jgi:hypothetical protein
MKHKNVTYSSDTSLSLNVSILKKGFMFDADTLLNSLQNHFRTENSFSQIKSLIIKMMQWQFTYMRNIPTHSRTEWDS